MEVNDFKKRAIEILNAQQSGDVGSGDMVEYLSSQLLIAYNAGYIDALEKTANNLKRVVEIGESK